ncbi:MAG: hypothetical protein ACQKBT_09215 [Puniceicoccales bacterium]
MNYPKTYLLASAALGLAMPLQADVLLNFDGTDDYSTADSNFSRLDVESGSGPYYSTVAFSDTNNLSPSSDYTGPTFYGGYQFSSSTIEGYLTRQQIRDYAAGDQIFLQAWKSGGWEDSTLTLHGLYVFKQEDFNTGYETGSISLEGVSMTWDGYITAKPGSGGSQFDGRLAIEIGGTYYLSQSKIVLTDDESGYSLSGSALENELWAEFDPFTDLNFDYGSASFGGLNLEGVSSVGIYFEEDGWIGSNAQGAAFGFGVESFTIEGSVSPIPEPSQMSSLLGIVALLASGICVRRKRR